MRWQFGCLSKAYAMSQAEVMGKRKEKSWPAQACHISGLKMSEELMELNYLLKQIIALILCHLS